METYKIEESFGFLVNRLATSIRWAFEKKLEKYDLTVQQYGFLARLFEEDSQPLSFIGKNMCCDKPTITGIANRLEKKGFIKKSRDDKDKRIVKAVLTEKGWGLKDILHKAAMGMNVETTKGISAEQVNLLKKLLRISLDNLSEINAGGV